MDQETRDFAPSEQLIEIAEEFVERVRDRESPTVEEYAERYPETAVEIHRYLPMLLPSDAAQSVAAVEAGSLPIAEELLPVGISRYHIKSLVGSGSMGAVYVAHDLELDRTVAFKMPQLKHGQAVERFYREARAMATVDHPNICAVYDVGEIRPEDVDSEELKGLVGRPYLTMGYIKGTDLSNLMTEEPWDAAKAANLVHQIAVALDVAHQAGVVHRDIKPRNIIIDRNEQPVVTDFGLARRRLAEEVELTIDGQIIGSPAYMSPEQINGHPELGPSADIYSLGIMLYELVCGLRPFSGSPLTLLRDICWKDPPSPRHHRADLDTDIESICMKAIAKSPDDRYATAAAFAADLRTYLDGRHVGEPRQKKRQRRRAIYGVTLACALIVAILSWHRSANEARQNVRAAGTSLPKPSISYERFQQRMDEIFLDHFKYRRHDTRTPDTSAAYADLFSQYGIKSGATSPKALKWFLSTHPSEARIDILVGLESWLLCGLRETEDVPVPWLRSLLESNHSDHTPIRRSLLDMEKVRSSFLIKRFAINHYDPRLPVIWSFYLRNFDRPTAKRLLMSAHNAYPDDLWVNAAIGLRKKDNGNHHGAITHFEKVVADAPSAAIYTQLGLSYLALASKQDVTSEQGLDVARKLRQDAGRVLRKAIELDPEYGMAHFGLGRSHFQLKEMPQAELDFATAIEKKCRSLGQAHGLYALVLIHRRDQDGAMESVMTAIPHLRQGKNWKGIVRFTTAMLDDLKASDEHGFVDRRVKLVKALIPAARQSRQWEDARPHVEGLLLDFKSIEPPDESFRKKLNNMLSTIKKKQKPAK